MKLPFYIVDVFAEKKYAGNQLAVFLDADGLNSEEMQKIAREINFAESTFITKIQPENNKAEIRIFTPYQEMQFAGHPIIGTSWVLMNKIFESHLEILNYRFQLVKFQFINQEIWFGCRRRNLNFGIFFQKKIFCLSVI